MHRTGSWDYALDHGAVIVTKDEDFAHMATLGDTSPIVVWARVGNTRRAPLFEWFEPLVDRIVVMVEAGDHRAALSVPMPGSGRRQVLLRY